MPNKGKGKGKCKGKGKQHHHFQQQQNKHKNQPQNAISDCIFPREVINEILTRLPVKSLLRFRCVCKQWHTSICSSKFITSHLNRSPNSVLIQCNPFGSYRMFMVKDPTAIDAKPVRLAGPDANLTFGRSPCSENCMDVIGCINGVICLSAPSWCGGFVLWSPATKQSRVISGIDEEVYFTLPSSVHSISLGFGHDPVGNDFKIIKNLGFSPELKLPDQIHVISMNFGSWRRVRFVLEYRFAGKKCDAVVQGFPCWRGSVEWEKEFREILICFDTVREFMVGTPMPDFCKGRCKHLMDYENQLAMVVWDDPKMNYLDFWLKKDDWTKIFHLGPVFGVVRMVGCWRSEEVFLEHEDETLKMHSIVTKARRSLCLEDNVKGSFEIFHYAESLVSLIGDKTSRLSDAKQVAAPGSLLHT